MQTVYSSIEPFLSFGSSIPTGIINNGDFTSDITGWNQTGGWTVINGQLTNSETYGANGFFYQTVPTVAGRTYTLSYKITEYISGGIGIYYDNSNGSDLAYGEITVGINSITFVAGTSNYQVSLKGYSFVGTLDWLQITSA
ncbi:hypothetical protein Q5H92_13850 [Hymenobacter sp. M29]|uniref:DUF642 domain-containing protein n=1 Tax=Hymenobacter mellowenesis TaxID=3063995 RepID=A0ABT9AC96_9BACT|nr:hypothetical protein [Hymenobacter sp. M29]MDO7847449.1 hypothetical protein [Hymenobacter sp. M29]